jgi:hypothetical protein
MCELWGIVRPDRIGGCCIWLRRSVFGSCTEITSHDFRTNHDVTLFH